MFKHVIKFALTAMIISITACRSGDQCSPEDTACLSKSKQADTILSPSTIVARGNICGTCSNIRFTVQKVIADDGATCYIATGPGSAVGISCILQK
jgi:hypothetical protein